MKRFLGFLTSLTVIGVPAFALWKHQMLFDWWKLQNFVPSAAITTLTNHDGLTTKGRNLFYVNSPELDDKKTFAGHCKTVEQSIVLGCYINTEGIYLLDVQDARLKGVQEVTAAHEMLHAAYDRLSTSERRHIDELTAAAFKTVTDERVIANVADYKKRDASVVPNELHSILATEVNILSPELETYYKRYFVDRQRIVAFSEQYEKVFVDIKNKVAGYDQQLEVLKPQIDQLEATVNLKGNTLEQSRKQLDALLATGQRDAYNAQVPAFNSQVRVYNQNVAKLKTLVDQFNAIVNQRNALALEQRDLVQSIDSRYAEK